MLGSIFMNQARDFYVVAAIFGNFHQLAFLEPIDGLQTFGSFLDTEGGSGNSIQRKPVLQLILDLVQHVQSRQLTKIQRGIAVQHFVIKAKIVESDNEVGSLQLSNEIVHAVLVIDGIPIACRAVGNTDTHAHLADLVPAADFIGRFLSLEIEIDNVLHHAPPNVRLPRADASTFAGNCCGIRLEIEGRCGSNICSHDAIEAGHQIGCSFEPVRFSCDAGPTH